MTKHFRYIIFLMIFFGQLYADQNDIYFTNVAYEQKGNVIIGKILLSDGSTWNTEIPVLNDYTLDRWKEGDIVFIGTNDERVVEGNSVRYKPLPGYQIENFDANSEIIAFPTKSMLSECLKIKKIAIDSGWFSNHYYIQTDDERWWKVYFNSLSYNWKEGQRVSIYKNNYFVSGYEIINFDISVANQRSEDRLTWLTPVDCCPATAH